MENIIRQRALPLWRDRQYLLWLGSDTGSAMGMALQSFTVPLVALVATGSPAQAGLIAALGQLVRVVCTLPGGVLADRRDRRKLMALGGTLGAVGGIGLCLAVVGGVLGFWTLLGLHLFLSARNGVFGSASDAALKDLVPESRLPSALAANQGRDAVISLAGGPLGGLLLSASQVLAFGAMATAHAVAALGARFIGSPAAPPMPGSRTARAPAPSDGSGTFRSYLADGTAGMAWLLRRRDLRGILLISTLLNLGINASIISVIFALQQRGESAATIGWVSASMGAGMLLGSLPAAALLKRLPTGLAVCTGLVVMAGAMAMLPFTQSPAWVSVLFGVSIFGAPTINAGLGGYFMSAVPSELLGRATSASALLGMAAVPLAPLIAGFGYPVWGWSGLLGRCAGICVFATVLAVANRPLRTLPVQADWAGHAEVHMVPGSKAPASRR